MTEPNQNPYLEGGNYQWGPTQPPGHDQGFANGYGHGAGYGAGFPQGSLVPAAGPYGAGVPLLVLGDITVLQDSIVTPNGTLPLKGAVWNALDMSRTEERIPTHAVVLAIVFSLLCLVGLLFLLMKEKRTTGFIQVTVTSAGRHHTTMIPATGPGTVHWVMGQLNYARSLSI
ncbi:hypothetical protein ACFU5O_09630 [Streptomyces sp. NPDC057445]|uniref:hypothetical protein n=1 Tax=Streptomyces sp. NPDC057445 TaxID=3346136 RepID=UPI003676EEF7